MKYRSLLFLLCILCASINTWAQAILSIDSNALSVIPDTVTYNSTDTVRFAIHNVGNQLFNGTINVYSIINGNLNSAADTMGGGINYSPLQDSIPVGDSIIETLVFTFSGPNFPASIAGPSVVVIWPVSNAALTRDSIRKNIFVDSTTTSIQNPATEKLKVYTDGSELLIKSEGQIISKRARIYDVTGALLQDTEISFNAAIPINQYASGVYIVEIILADNERLVYKVVK